MLRENFSELESRYALVERVTMTVIGIQSHATAPPMVQGFEYINEDEWKPGNIAGVGDIWDGEIPAGFTAAPPIEMPESIAAAIDALEADMQARITALRQITG